MSDSSDSLPSLSLILCLSAAQVVVLHQTLNLSFHYISPSSMPDVKPRQRLLPERLSSGAVAYLRLLERTNSLSLPRHVHPVVAKSAISAVRSLLSKTQPSFSFSPSSPHFRSRFSGHRLVTKTCTCGSIHVYVEDFSTLHSEPADDLCSSIKLMAAQTTVSRLTLWVAQFRSPKIPSSLSLTADCGPQWVKNMSPNSRQNAQEFCL